jgi:hypothetical protein
MTTLLFLIFVGLIILTMTIVHGLGEVVDVLKEIKDVSDVILGSIERIERDLQGHE